MKRVALCTAILLVIILLCTASLVTVSRYQRDFTKAIQDLEQAVYQETFEAFIRPGRQRLPGLDGRRTCADSICPPYGTR